MVLAVTGATGKICGATLNALVKYELVPQSEIVVMTSSALDSEKVKALRKAFPSLKAIRHASYTDAKAVQEALAGVDVFFLVSTPEKQLDYHDAPKGKGREGSHYSAIDGAVAAGVSSIVYTSLAFGTHSKAGVMRAHLRTEEYLVNAVAKDKLSSYTILREGLYNESWPLYLGHYKIGTDSRKEIVVAGDGPIAWTSIPDLGLATASILAEIEKGQGGPYQKSTVTLSQQKTVTLGEVARLLNVKLSVCSPQDYIAHYRDEAGMDEAFLEWWSSSYPSVAANHCGNDPMSPLESLLASKGVQPKAFEATFQEMMGQK